MHSKFAPPTVLTHRPNTKPAIWLHWPKLCRGAPRGPRPSVGVYDLQVLARCWRRRWRGHSRAACQGAQLGAVSREALHRRSRQGVGVGVGPLAVPAHAGRGAVGGLGLGASTGVRSISCGGRVGLSGSGACGLRGSLARGLITCRDRGGWPAQLAVWHAHRRYAYERLRAGGNTSLAGRIGTHSAPGQLALRWHDAVVVARVVSRG